DADQPAATTQQPKRAPLRLAADTVDDRVDVVQALLDALESVVDRRGPEAAQVLEVARARGREYVGAEVARVLDRERADPTTATEHQHALLRLQRSRVDGLHGREPAQRQLGGLVHADARGRERDAALGHTHTIGV